MPITVNGINYYTVAEAAEKLGLTIATVRRAIRDGRMEYSRPGITRISELQLQKYMDTPPANDGRIDNRPGPGKQLGPGKRYFIRLIYGEAGNEQGHVEVMPNAIAIPTAKRLLTMRRKAYGQPSESWGRIEYRGLDDDPDAWRPIEG